MVKKKERLTMNERMGYSALALVRIALGFTFLWAFFDKLMGLGFATCRSASTNAVTTMCSQAWLKGGSPTAGFLTHATRGPLAGFYQSLAGHPVVDWLFMMGLLGIGVALILGVAMRVAAISGAALLLMMWSASLWPANNPLVDDHIVYVLVLLTLWLTDNDQRFGMRRTWRKQALVKRFPILQ